MGPSPKARKATRDKVYGMVKLDDLDKWGGTRTDRASAVKVAVRQDHPRWVRGWNPNAIYKLAKRAVNPNRGLRGRPKSICIRTNYKKVKKIMRKSPEISPGKVVTRLREKVYIYLNYLHTGYIYSVSIYCVTRAWI